MAKPRRNDINIGKDQWITWVDIDGRQQEAVDIDYLINPMKDFWARLETQCVAECCGIDAFALWPDNINQASAGLRDPALLQKLRVLQNRIVESDEKTFVSKTLNNYFDREVLLQLIDHIVTHVESS